MRIQFSPLPSPSTKSVNALLRIVNKPLHPRPASSSSLLPCRPERATALKLMLQISISRKKFISNSTQIHWFRTQLTIRTQNLFEPDFLKPNSRFEPESYFSTTSSNPICHELRIYPILRVQWYRSLWHQPRRQSSSLVFDFIFITFRCIDSICIDFDPDRINLIQLLTRLLIESYPIQFASSSTS